MKNMRKTYSKEKAEKVFYASANKGKIKGVHGEDIEKYATEDGKEFLNEEKNNEINQQIKKLKNALHHLEYPGLISKHHPKANRYNDDGTFSKMGKEEIQNIKNQIRQLKIKKQSREDIEKYATEDEKAVLKEDIPSVLAALPAFAGAVVAGTNFYQTLKMKNKKEGEELKKIAAKRKNNKKLKKEDIEKYATEDEKLFLEGLEDFRGGDTAITGEEEDDMDYLAQEQNPEGMKSLRRLKLQKKLGGSHGFKHFTQPFDKHGNPRKYLEILFALEAAPSGLSKLEIYNYVLGKDYSPYQAKGQDVDGMWRPLKEEGLYITRRDPKTGKLRLFIGPRWNEYKKKILGVE